MKKQTVSEILFNKNVCPTPRRWQPTPENNIFSWNWKDKKSEGNIKDGKIRDIHFRMIDILTTIIRNLDNDCHATKSEIRKRLKHHTDIVAYLDELEEKVKIYENIEPELVLINHEPVVNNCPESIKYQIFNETDISSFCSGYSKHDITKWFKEISNTKFKIKVSFPHIIKWDQKIAGGIEIKKKTTTGSKKTMKMLKRYCNLFHFKYVDDGKTRWFCVFFNSLLGRCFLNNIKNANVVNVPENFYNLKLNETTRLFYRKFLLTNNWITTNGDCMKISTNNFVERLSLTKNHNSLELKILIKKCLKQLKKNKLISDYSEIIYKNGNTGWIIIRDWLKKSDEKVDNVLQFVK